jgi:hypothetical protein
MDSTASFRATSITGAPGRMGFSASATLGCRVDAGVFEDLPDGGRGDGDAEHQQFAVHPPVFPVGILLCQPQNKRTDGAHEQSQSAQHVSW